MGVVRRPLAAHFTPLAETGQEMRDFKKRTTPSHSVDLKEYGWDDFFEAQFATLRRDGCFPARVIAADRGRSQLIAETGRLEAKPRGRLAHQGETAAVGDWVALSQASAQTDPAIESILARKSCFTRQAAGSRSREQIVGANIDIVFLVMSMDRDFNLRRLERYLILSWESGARPVVLLSKSDLCSDAASAVVDAESVALGVPVHPISSLRGEGLEALNHYLSPGSTVALLGSSGAGKTTLANALLGSDLLTTGAVRARDGRGRHTTVRRQLEKLPGGGLLLDTPGMRELQLWEGAEGLKDVFEDIEQLAASCRFGDCSHEAEPDCAVKKALAAGRLDPLRLQSFQSLQRELERQSARHRKGFELAERKRKEKIIHKENRRIIRSKRR